jgi:hypothetical protein
MDAFSLFIFKARRLAEDSGDCKAKHRICVCGRVQFCIKRGEKEIIYQMMIDVPLLPALAHPTDGTRVQQAAKKINK